MKHVQSGGSTVLFCFTPLVTLATFIIEACFSVYTIIRYRKHKLGQLAALLLILLSLFQLAEYMLCKTPYTIVWTKVGYVAITFLPAVGLSMVSELTGKSRYNRAAYLGALMLSALVVVSPNIFHGAICTGKFVIFQAISVFDYVYGIYYMSFVFLGCILLAQGIHHRHGKIAAMNWMLLGYASFILPSYALNILVRSTKHGLPSIMCGFAVLLSIIVVSRVVPLGVRRAKK